jgi:Xaa-Pro dipeptidase
MFDLDAIQAALREFGVDGWLIYDFRKSNLPGRRVLGIDDETKWTRRFLYAIPARGTPRKLVHRIEPGALDHLPGERDVYSRWQVWEEKVAAFVAGMDRVAMEYAPRGRNPYVACVDAGTVELIRGAGPEVVSSGDLVQIFEATWDDEQWAMHLKAECHTRSAYDRAWGLIAERTADGGSVGEAEVQEAILDHFEENGLTTYAPPIVAVGPHSGNPHYEPNRDHDTPIRRGDFVLIDLWAKLNLPRSRAVYSDLTRVGFVGTTVPDEYEKIFRIVARARDAAIDRVRSAFAAGVPLHGWEVDVAAREVIKAAGHGEHFVHRTGHSIGQETHGNGANMDDLETHDERLVLRRTCFSIEPGIYLDDFGVRSEVNVFVDAAGTVHVTGGLQSRVVPILDRAEWPCD